VLGASRRLVAWVAAGRTANDQISAVEAAFAQWIHVTDEEQDAAIEAIRDSVMAYADAWDAAVQSTG
jgi:hypothetical protein